MDGYQVFSIVITLTAIASYINYRYIRLPQPIGITLLTVLFSLVLIFLSQIGFDLKSPLYTTIDSIDLSETILNGMLKIGRAHV